MAEKRVVVVASGGLDSTVLAYQMKAEGHEVIALSVNYNQRHAKELKRAALLMAGLGVMHRVANLVDVGRTLLRGSSQTSPNIAVPYGHYTDASMKATVVPNRNMLLLSLALATAVQEGADRVVYGAHAGDHAIYPDCRPEFVAAMQQAAGLCDWMPIRLDAPFVTMTKSEIVQRGAELKVPMGKTWSCYEGGLVHCGRCGTCVERLEAFAGCSVPDPTVYAPGPNTSDKPGIRVLVDLREFLASDDAHFDVSDIY